MGYRWMRYLALLVIVCSSTAATLSGTTRPLSPADPMSFKHIEYAKYVFRDRWQDHLADISQKWNVTMGTSDPSVLDSVTEFNNFFTFVRETNPSLASHYLALNGYLKTPQSYLEMMRKAVKDHDFDEFYVGFENMLGSAYRLEPVLAEARPRILKAASIYQVPLGAVDDSVESFDEVETAFVNQIRNSLNAMAQEFPKRDKPWGSAFYKDLLEGTFMNLIENASFIYKRDGKDDFVSFVNFGKIAFHKWDGFYGGDGAIDTDSFQFLDL